MEHDSLGGLNYGYYTNFNYFFNYFLHFNDDSVTFYSVCSDFGKSLEKQTHTVQFMPIDEALSSEKDVSNDTEIDEINKEQKKI